MRKITLLMILSLFAVGCVSGSMIPSPTFHQNGVKKFVVEIHATNTNGFAPSTDSSYYLECEGEAPPMEVYTDQPETELGECQPVRGRNHDAASGAMQGFVAPVLDSASYAYGMNRIGKGIGDSGDNTTNNNSSGSGSASSSASNAQSSNKNNNRNQATGGGGGEHPGCQNSGNCD